jgi:diguanylate cyclase (GGDEF)-like protein
MNLLIVDDDLTSLKLLRTQLESEGHAVFEAYDGVDALALLERQRVDAVISDVLMPRMDGYRLCNEIRKHSQLYHLPIIIYTSTYTSPGDEKLALDVGADKYLKKPLSVQHIIAALHEVIAVPHAVRHSKALQEVDVPKEYSEKLVSKLKEKNTELQAMKGELQGLLVEERELTAQLSHQALHDPLTGLANRALFEDRLAQAHARVVRQGGRGAVLLLDLDDFKGVNDTHGHLVGDQLLVTIARRLEQVTRSSDTLCRFGGDEFLYLAEGLASAEEAEQVATRLLAALIEPFSIAEAHVEQHASIGVVVWDERSMDYTQLIQDADVAMYEAKRQGKGHHVVFAPAMRQQATSRFALLQELRHALQAGELSMHYQPIVDLTTTEVVGFEALMRWQHPVRGWVPPDVFIPLAEQSDLIVDLGSFALREAMAAASSWEPTGAHVRAPYVTVNLSAHQFHDPDLRSMIEEALRTSGLAPERLVIEITESVTLLDVAETLSVMEHLNHLGIGIALDDFGTGYSSLSYLVLLHPRVIKIDRSFVSPVRESVRNDTLLETIVSLGSKLDITMLAEGIETHAQLERLRNLGCELGQGYLFSPAVPAGGVAAVLGPVLGSRG